MSHAEVEQGWRGGEDTTSEDIAKRQRTFRKTRIGEENARSLSNGDPNHTTGDKTCNSTQSHSWEKSMNEVLRSDNQDAYEMV